MLNRSSIFDDRVDELRHLGVSEKDLKEMIVFKDGIKKEDLIPGGGAAPSRIAQDRRAPRFK